MTTVAWDGNVMAADTLATDYWGLKEVVEDKILVGNGFLVGCAGEHGAITRWWREVKEMTLEEVLEHGYPYYLRDVNDPALMLATKEAVYRHCTGIFFKCARTYHAVGSGRDYALGAMYCGRDAVRAVETAMHFDNGTGGKIVQHRLPASCAK